MSNAGIGYGRPAVDSHDSAIMQPSMQGVLSVVISSRIPNGVGGDYEPDRPCQMVTRVRHVILSHANGAYLAVSTSTADHRVFAG